jgi:uncharacterized phage protein gp47/JayE
MPITDTSLYRQRDEIVAEMIAQLLAAIPDAYTDEDGVITILFQVEAGQLENLYLAHQLLLEDMFIQTASYQALLLYGDQYGLLPNVGLNAKGQLTFSGDGGTYVDVGSEAGYDPGGGLDVIYYVTTADGTIPNPGNPTAPVATASATVGALSGTYEYAITFVTAEGETLLGPVSNAVNPVAKQVNLSAIPVGGPGTVFRNIYRDKNGAGNWRFIGQTTDNAVTTFTDNMTDAAHDTQMQAPTVDTAHAVTVDAQAEEVGAAGNVGVGLITEVSDAPSGVNAVTNLAPFTGGDDEEDTEDYRARLLSFVQNPQSGSPSDLKEWAEEVDGVETATVFTNTPSAGSVTIRIAGPDGIVPDASVIQAVSDALIARDLANITIVVSTFTAVPTAVSVTTTLDSTYALADVQQAVINAITDYINGLDVGATLYVSGIVDAVFGLPGILDVVVTTPASNQTTGASSKRTPGTITVT